jgi:hypothetical protein
MMWTMTEAGTISVIARVAYGTKDQLKELKALFTAERRRAREIQGQEQWNAAGLAGREAAARRAAWAEHRAGLRRRGELVDTLDVLVACGVRAELAERGWDAVAGRHRPRRGCPAGGRARGMVAGRRRCR